MWYVYVLKSTKDNKWYTGLTDSINTRLKKHNSGKVFSTKSRKPFKIIYYEASLDKKDAEARERYLKSGMGKRYIKNRLKNYFNI